MPLDENRDARSLSAASDTEEGEHLTWSADTLLRDLGIEDDNDPNSSGHYAGCQERHERHDALASMWTAWTISQQGRASPVGHIPGLGHCDPAPATPMSPTLMNLFSLLADTKSTDLEYPCIDQGSRSIDKDWLSLRTLSPSPSLLGPPEEGDTAEHNTGTPQDTSQPLGGTWADVAATSNTGYKLKTVPMRGVTVSKGPAGTARAKGAVSSGPLTVRSEILQQPSGLSGSRASNPVTGPPASSTASVKTGHWTKRSGNPLPSLAKRGLVKRPVPFPRSQAGSSTGPRWQDKNWRVRDQGGQSARTHRNRPIKNRTAERSGKYPQESEASRSPSVGQKPVARSLSAKKNNLFGVLEDDSDDGDDDVEEDEKDEDVEGALGGHDSDNDDDQEHHDEEAFVRGRGQGEDPEVSNGPEITLYTVGGTMPEAGMLASDSGPDPVGLENELSVKDAPKAKRKKRRRPGRRKEDAIAGAFKNLISIMNATQTSSNKPDHDGDAVQILEGSPSVSTSVRSAIISLMKSLATAGDASDLSGRSLWEPFGGAAHAKDLGNGGNILKSPQARMGAFARSLEASMNDVNRDSCRRLGEAWEDPSTSPEMWSEMRLDVGARLAKSGLGTLTTAEALGLDTYHKKGCLRFKSEGSKSACCAHPDGEIAKSWRQTSTAGSSSRGG